MIPFPALTAMSKWCADVAPAVENHLWQSTVFAAVAAVLTLALRRNQARARYWIWMAASIKFLVPFALLMSVGGMMARPRATAAVVAQPSVYLAMEEVSQPFVEVMVPVVQATAPTAASTLAALAPAIVASVWTIGFATVLCVWLVRWRRMARAMRSAEPMREGRELAALRRLEQAGGVRAPIRLLLSPGAMEPGVFGVGGANAVLAWPKGISERLDDAHLEAILAHEVAHVRRRDNLTAAMHMVVEAVFWFHPLVWWVGARLLAERERACDEEVLQLCGRPAVYAEGILKVCEYCVESPLACVSGVTGADLKQRIVEIMTARVVRRIGLGRKLLLLGAGMVVVAVPVLAGRSRAMRDISSLAIAPPPSMMPKFLTGGDVQANAPADEAVKAAPQDAATPAPAAATDAAYALGPEFEVATIRPTDPNSRGGGSYVSSSGRFEGQNTTLRGLVRFAYGSFPHPSGDDASGGPDWAGSEHFDVEAKVDDAQMANWSKMSNNERIELVKPMLRRLLVERFQLKLHTETHIKDVFALVQAKGGAKLKEVAPPPPINDDAALKQNLQESMAQKSPKPIAGSFMMSDDQWLGNSIPIEMLLGEIAVNAHLDAPLIDLTGLRGYYDFTMKVSHGEDAPLLIDQVEMQLGLRVESRKLPLRTYVIDAAEKPSVDGAELPNPPSATLTPVSFAQTAPTQPSANPQPTKPLAFDVVSVKPNNTHDSHPGSMIRSDGFDAENMTPIWVMWYAYGFGAQHDEDLFSGLPAWASSERFDIIAKVAEADVPAWNHLTDTGREQMVRNVLADRFKLQTHTETVERPIYALVLAKGGPKLKPSPPPAIGKPAGPAWFGSSRTGIAAGNTTTKTFAGNLTSLHLGRAVQDQTGLTGLYDIKLDYAPMQASAPAAADEASTPSGQPDIFTAIQEQLGLKLVPTKGSVEVLVIDHIERPSEN